MKALTFNQYRLINMTMLTVVFIVLETIIAKGANVWFPELAYTLSLATVFISLEMMRWGGFAGISAVVSGLVLCIASGANPSQYIIYCVGNLFTLLALLFLKLVGYDRVKQSAFLTIVYVIIVFLLQQLGRWGVSTVMGNDIRMIFQFIATDALSGIFALVVVLISRQAEGLFENQRSYIRRMNEERQVRERE